MQPFKIMSNTTRYEKWVSDASARIKQASVKLAAAQSELNVTDPTEQGHAAPPAKHDGNNLSLLDLPASANNSNDTNLSRNIVSVTDPNGTGEGSYITPKNGDAQDAAATSPTAPLDKIAANLANAIDRLNSKQVSQPAPAEKQAAAEPAEAPEKQASQPEFSITPGFSAQPDIMKKLAAVGAVMIGTEEGQMAVARELERQGGIKEASAMVQEARRAAYEYAAMQKQAAAQAQAPSAEEVYMQKVAAAGQLAHMTWYSQLRTDLEKNAYAQGAADGEAAAQALAAGEEPTIDGAEGLSDEDAAAVIQSMVESQEITPEEAQMLLGAASSPEALSQVLAQLVQAQELSPEEAQALAAQLLGGEGAPEEGALADEVPADVAAAAGEGVKSAAAIVQGLFE